jgi:hypothetical protein
MKFKGTANTNTINIKRKNNVIGGDLYLPGKNGIFSAMRDFNIETYEEDYINFKIEKQYA